MKIREIQLIRLADAFKKIKLGEKDVGTGERKEKTHGM